MWKNLMNLLASLTALMVYGRVPGPDAERRGQEWQREQRVWCDAVNHAHLALWGKASHDEVKARAALERVSHPSRLEIHLEFASSDALQVLDFNTWALASQCLGPTVEPVLAKAADRAQADWVAEIAVAKAAYDEAKTRYRDAMDAVRNAEESLARCRARREPWYPGDFMHATA